ncbi:unnamed protein product [Plutella xylostella]|uniref:(diamondback moth) hypothetical protein n=1 Tax=Plutella xylostella TaxID=51655 RepID=A0A8S4FQB1_PLUXY|nr:unnamed protein product [Plutella xylostella]
MGADQTPELELTNGAGAAVLRCFIGAAAVPSRFPSGHPEWSVRCPTPRRSCCWLGDADGNDTNGSCGSNSQRELDNVNISAATDISGTIPDDITTAECTVRIPEVISPSFSRRSNLTLETKTARKRLIKSVQQLTPRCKIMYQKCSTILKSRRPYSSVIPGANRKS